MEKILSLTACLLALNLTPLFGQPGEIATPYQKQLQTIINAANPTQPQPPPLTKFNLDFSGGTPADLVKAIEKATGKPLNAIIPTEDADFELPPLNLHNVTFPQLSDAMRQDSSGTAYAPQLLPYSYVPNVAIQTGYDFRTTDNPPTDDSIWFFHVQRPPPAPQKPTVQQVCRFYQLTAYLDHGFTVDDITTAIQTGWKMSGVNPPPELNYHKETKLLIAYGAPGDLDIIQSVLYSLPSSNATRSEINALHDEIGQLKGQVDRLKMQISASKPPASNSPEEKSGK